MIISDKTMRRLGHEIIQPFIPYKVVVGGLSGGLTSHGYDVSIGEDIAVYKEFTGSKILDPADFKEELIEYKKIPSDEYLILYPHRFILATTVEYIKMPFNMVAEIKDKSTYARCGIAVQNTVVDAGFRGRITLEITNHNSIPVIIRPNTPIARLLFYWAEECEAWYSGKYQDQTTVTPPRSG